MATNSEDNKDSNDHHDIQSLAGLPLNSYSFEPFEIYTQSKADAAYIIAAISIISCIVVAFGSPILKAVMSKKKEDKTKY